MNNFEKTLQEIRTLKIQGATRIAQAGLKALLDVAEEEIPQALEALVASRPTEPLLKNCLNLVKNKGKTVILPTLSRLEDINQEIVKYGLSLIKEGDCLLTHCHSSTVVSLLKEAKNKGINFKVYLTETRPVFQGRVTAKELLDAHLSVVMITDSEAAFLVSRHDRREINSVILGADAITFDGGAINKVGSYGIALAAKEAKIPVYLLATLLKFSPEKIIIEERHGKEIWAKKPENLEILNPAFDFLPPDLITGFITEFGLVKPEKVKTLVKKNYPWILESGKKLEKSTNPYRSYLHLGEKVDPKKNLIVHFALTVERGHDFAQIAGGVAAESSVGTWTKVSTEIKEMFDSLHARVLEADKKTGFLKIAYPLALFEEGNLSQLLSSVAGNVFGLKEVKNLKLLDLDFPEKYVRGFPGPAFGIEGVRRLTGIKSRPLIGCIIKPKLGLEPKIYGQISREVFEGGVDFVKDDENLTSQIFNLFPERVKVITKILKEEKFKNKIYALNVTAEVEVMLERAKMVETQGGNCVMIDFLTAGFAGLQALRKKNFNLFLHGHRAMHAAFDRVPAHGISMLVLAKLARLAGLDSLHTGTVVGKMEGEKEEINKINQFLLGDWHGLKKVLPVASGGLHPALVPSLMKILGKDVLFNFGGGIHGHPQGSAAGAAAVLEAVEATEKGLSLLEAAKTHEALAIALEHWEGRK